MRAQSTRTTFEPRARLLLQLGDRLIKNENIALLELIKNSYDADAKSATVSLQNVGDAEHGIIDITDDGTGMSMEIVENVWLEPGSDYKADLFARNVRSPKFQRLPIGEKGIGRFGVHKLGSRIEMITKAKGGNEVVVEIDWTKFANHKYLKDANIKLFERTPEYFKGPRTGTRIRITQLRSSWDRRMIRDLYRSMLSLNSPFKKQGSFTAILEVDEAKMISDLPTWAEIQEWALYHFKCTIEKDEITSFTYSFRPWPTMVGIEPRTVSLDGDPFVSEQRFLMRRDPESKKEVSFTLDKNYGTENEPAHIGKVEFEGYVFDLDKRILALGDESKARILGSYLGEQGGLRVYRDNIRINEYGDKGNDWLNLDVRRVNLPVKRISNNIIISAIDLESKSQKALIEKTNREGFIENEAFLDFASAILYVINLIETLRDTDKSFLRLKYGPQDSDEPVTSNIMRLREIIGERIEDGPARKEIVKLIDRIEADYKYIQEVLLTSAGAGLTLSIGIHEVEKVLHELTLKVHSASSSEVVLPLVERLVKLVTNYSDLLRQSKKTSERIADIVEGSLGNVEFRLDTHGIELESRYKKYTGNQEVKCSKRLSIGALLNALDNSIYWLDRKSKRLAKEGKTFNKKILVDIISGPKGYVDIIVADNGDGFHLPTEQVTKPFVTSKHDGIGLGLHIAKEVLQMQDGQLLFPSHGDIGLADEYALGAIVAFRFKII
jgi:signal transduction histidine kinase